MIFFYKRYVKNVMLLIYPPPVWSASTTRQTFDIQTFGSGHWIYQQTVCKNKGEAASRLAAGNQQQNS